MIVEENQIDWKFQKRKDPLSIHSVSYYKNIYHTVVFSK